MKTAKIRKVMMESYGNGGKIKGKIRSLYVLREIERFCTLIGSKHIYEYTTISQEVSDILIHYGINMKQQGVGFQVAR